MIELRSVSKRYGGGDAAVEDLSMEIASHEFCVLVGPSGCGKTTTLKMINRLIEPTSGEILIDDVDVTKMDVVQLRRGIGYVMQQGGLFPHLRVSENVAAVPRLLGWPKPKVAARVEELLDLVGLPPAEYLRRYPHELSGGERQRVGVARALGADPNILLMDEPFGAVDPIARKRLQEEFKALQSRLGKTVVFVTHDIEEAIFLGHRIALMHKGGVLEQYDTPAAILAKPASPFVAEFVGAERDLQRLAVSDLSREDVETPPTAAASATAAELELLATQAGATRVAVMDGEGALLGLVDATELNGNGQAADLAQPTGPPLAVGVSLRHALAAVLDDDAGVLPVTDRGEFVGVLTLEGIHQAMRRSAVTPPAPD